MEALKKELLNGMLDFIKGDDDADYSPSQVEECAVLLANFQKDISSNCSNLNEAMPHVQSVIINLNELNERCDECLIETDQREQICEFIDLVLSNASIPTEGDVTEEWREW